MKKYICPSIDIKQKLYLYIMAGSPDAYNVVGQGQYTNESVFDETEDVDPSKGKGFWDDAN